MVWISFCSATQMTQNARNFEVFMGRARWERIDSIDESAAFAGKHNRAWQIFSLVLLVAMATFAGAFYLPLYRAHAALSNEYRVLSKDAATQRGQLEQTLVALKTATSERDSLSHVAEAKVNDQQVDSGKLAGVEQQIRTQNKKLMDAKLLKLEKMPGKLRYFMSSPGLVAANGSALTEAGKSAACNIAKAASGAGVVLDVTSSPFPSAKRKTPDWQIAAVAVGTTALTLTDKCQIAPRSANIQPGQHNDAPVAGVVIEVGAGK